MRRQNHLGRVWLELRTPLIAAGVVSVVCLAAPPAVGAQVEITAVNRETVAEFTATFIKEFTRQNPDEAELTFGLAPEQRQAIVELAVTAAEFREAMAAAASGQGGAAAQDDIDLFTKSLELGPDGPPPALWRSFFQGSVIAVGHALAPVKRAGFYNALVDGWILADWAPDKEGLSLVGVRAVPGAVVRYQEVTGIQLPPWTRMTDESVITALGAAHREAMRAFKARYPLVSTRQPPDSAADRRRSDRQIVESRLGAMRRSLGILGRPAFVAATRAFLDSVDSGDPRRLRSLIAGKGPASAVVHRVSGLLTPIRSQFRPTGVVHRPDGITVMFGVPVNGRWVLAARYKPEKGDEALVLQSIGFIDLISAEKSLISAEKRRTEP